MSSTKDTLQVLYEDNHIIAINKRAGDIVQGDKTGDMPLSDIVKAYLVEKYNKKGDAYLGVVHRLDRPTTGVVLFAKTSKILPRLNKLFSEKQQITKKYWALIEQNVPIEQEATLVHWLIRDTEKNKSKAFVKEVPNSKRAELSYKVIQKLNSYYVVEVQIFTGRHHQIRSQFSSLGCYIKGDVKYGAKRSNPDGSIGLHAREISFIHPVKKEKITIVAPLPTTDSVWKAVETSAKNEDFFL